MILVPKGKEMYIKHFCIFSRFVIQCVYDIFLYIVLKLKLQIYHVSNLSGQGAPRPASFSKKLYSGDVLAPAMEIAKRQFTSPIICLSNPPMISKTCPRESYMIDRHLGRDWWKLLKQFSQKASLIAECFSWFVIAPGCRRFTPCI